MKVIFIFLLFGFIFLCGCSSPLCGCSSPFSPVGTWKLYIKRNNKVEKMQTPETVIMIYHDGTFLCVAKENPHPEYNKGNWYQKGKKIVFKDKNGQYRMFINKDSLILEQQPFKPQGMELIYLRKHSEK